MASTRHINTIAAAMTVLAGVTIATTASRANNPPQLIIELNNAEQHKSACRLTLLVENRLRARINKLSLELVLFDLNKRVMKLISVDAGTFRTGKTRIKQFDLATIKCADISRILLNNITHCAGDQLTPATCLDAALPRTQSNIPFTY